MGGADYKSAPFLCEEVDRQISLHLTRIHKLVLNSDFVHIFRERGTRDGSIRNKYFGICN